MILVDNVSGVSSSLVVETEDEDTNRPRPSADHQLVSKTKVIDDPALMNELPYGCNFELENPRNPQGNQAPSTSVAAGTALIDPPIPQGVRRFRRGGFTRYHCREFILEMPSREERLFFHALDPCSNVFGQSHFLCSQLKNRVAFSSYCLSAGARKMMAEENAGGASELSEALSFELFNRVFNADLYKTEMDIQYNFEQGKRTDYLVHMKIGTETRCIAVSVTRAMKYSGVFSLDDADYLLRKKLYGVLVSNGNVLESNRWEKQILHIFCEQKYIADRLQQVFKQFQRDDPEFVDNTLVFVTVCNNAKFIFTNRDENNNPHHNAKNAMHAETELNEEQGGQYVPGQRQGQRLCQSCKQPLAILGTRDIYASSPLQPSSLLGDIGGFGSQFDDLCSDCKQRRTMEALIAAIAAVAVQRNSSSMQELPSRSSASLYEDEPSVLMVVTAPSEGFIQNSWPVGRGYMWRSDGRSDKPAGWEEAKEALATQRSEQDGPSAEHYSSSLLSVVVDLQLSRQADHSAVSPLPTYPTSCSASSYSDGSTSSCSEFQSSSMICTYCSRSGHDISECFQKLYDGERSRGVDQKSAEYEVLKQMQESFNRVKKCNPAKLIAKVLRKFEAAFQEKFANKNVNECQSHS